MARDGRTPFNQRTDTGLMGFRYPDEPTDARPVLRWSQFWANESERMTYEDAVAKYPRGNVEGPLAYTQRISAVVTGLYAQAGQPMPRRGKSQREWAARQWEVKRAGGHAHYEEPVK